MPLNTFQLKLFRDQGYAIIRDMFTDREVDAMCAELDRFKRDSMLRNVATDGDGETHSTTQINLQICPITPKSPFYRALHFHPKVLTAVELLIGNPFVFYLDQIFLKPGKQGMGTNWHQDNAYFKISDPAKGVGMWVALHDATIENGTIHIVPGSHRETFPHDRDPNSDHHICCTVPEEDVIPVELPAGGAIFFNYGIAHCTRANTTDQERAGLALHFLNTSYIPESAREKKSYTHLSGPLASGGREEYGLQISDTWSSEVDRVLTQAEKA
ncbi:MAG: phytanoyl-CoA dioxygenase family protein [Candidatus Latescibacteria bacterium]|nr:phytanoyl-CoA dioxygenase family protein [Candidatus Latescibacterota bacterium]